MEENVTTGLVIVQQAIKVNTVKRSPVLMTALIMDYAQTILVSVKRTFLVLTVL